MEEARAVLGGEAPQGEAFPEGDRDRMRRFVRLTKKPCPGFKILGAGRRARRRESIEAGFRYAHTRLEAGDAVIVGMEPRNRDEITENVDVARTALAAV